MDDSDFAPQAFHTSSSRLSAPLSPLSETEIVDFYHEIDRDDKGFVTFSGLTKKLEQVVDELSSASNLRSHRSEDTEGGSQKFDNARLQSFLHGQFPASASSIAKTDFVAHVRSWNVPSLSQAALSEPRPPLIKGLRARWKVDGPRIAFFAFIVALQLAIGFWQMIKYIKSPLVRSVFGWGVILSKAANGAIYPTFFFLLLSMSRYFATLIRRFKYVPRILNWDRSQSTHVWMAIVGLVLSNLHAIGHLTGSFVHGSNPAHEAAVQKVFAPDAAPESYLQFIKTLPGWTGITALGLYWIIAIPCSDSTVMVMGDFSARPYSHVPYDWLALRTRYFKNPAKSDAWLLAGVSTLSCSVGEINSPWTWLPESFGSLRGSGRMYSYYYIQA